MSITKSLKNAMLTGNGLVSWHNNEPIQYDGKQRQYFSPETRTFTQQMARYSSDYVEAQVQGIDAENPLGWQTRYLRMADIVKPTAAIQRNFDDYKMILFADRDIEYVMPGSKIVTVGSTWIVVNPANISGSDGAAIVRRCNAVWNFLDYYGNVQSEPLVVENSRANANDSDNQQSLLISKGYFNVIAQYNDATRQIDTNTRIILGTAAYRVTGYSDFETEFTGDYSSVRTLSFTIRYEEPNEAIDDMENHIAGGKTFAWAVSVEGQGQLPVGSTTQFTANSTRNGIPVSYTAQFPIHYDWESSDETVATVDNFGNVVAIAEGEAIITATLYENNAYSASYGITVTESADGVAFNGTIPNTLNAYESATITAAYFEANVETVNALNWTFSGADETAYAATVSENGKSAAVTCYGYSETPLTITAEYGGFTANATITLLGI